MNVPPFNTWLGTEVVRAADGEAEVRIDLQAHHCNKRGVAHGGVVTALLDTALGAAVISSIPQEWWCATTSLSTQFIDGSGAGTLVGTGRVLRRGSRIAYAAGEVRDEGGRLTPDGAEVVWNRPSLLTLGRVPNQPDSVEWFRWQAAVVRARERKLAEQAKRDE